MPRLSRLARGVVKDPGPVSNPYYPKVSSTFAKS